MTPAVAALLVGIALLARADWPTNLLMAPIEILSAIGNVLSYLRLAAIGLASVYLAQVANDMAGMVGSVWLGLIIAALFHALNLVMGAFSPTIHALRLHYVEFFGKFYEEGGAAFSPFGRQ
jgi:V/A-type H+-transporting ATPase subunit I